jgi:hypothetical protein
MFRRAILHADPPAQGVKIARRMTLIQLVDEIKIVATKLHKCDGCSKVLAQFWIANIARESL